MSKSLKQFLIAIPLCLIIPILFARICQNHEDSKIKLNQIIDVKKFENYCQIKYKASDGDIFELAYFKTVIDNKCQYSIGQIYINE